MIGKPEWFRKMKGLPSFMWGTPVPVSWQGWAYLVAMFFPVIVLGQIIPELFTVSFIWFSIFCFDFAIIQFRVYTKKD